MKSILAILRLLQADISLSEVDYHVRKRPSHRQRRQALPLGSWCKWAVELDMLGEYTESGLPETWSLAVYEWCTGVQGDQAGR